ncbi:hypothetical protein KJ909_02885 [Patescibacteria group bacterium]|nr:hypothetical protein [Patescibacteria group bacterium]
MKFLSKLIIIFAFFLFASPLKAQDNLPTIDFFWGEGCPHCAKEEIFLDDLQKQYPELVINRYEIHDPANNQFLKETGQRLNADTSGIPFTVVADQYFVGFLSDDSTGQKIKQALGLQEKTSTLDTLNLPLFGTVAVKDFSLPLLTFVIALLDGFNPCAMWTLMFLISLLLGLKDRRRMWILGIAFIASSALVYFLFLTAWLNLFLFIGFITWVKILIALVALASGTYYLKDYFTNKDASCKVTGGPKKQKVFARLKAITQKEQFIFALIGIILLAFVVNLVELVCSAGLPAIYTQILAFSDLPTWQYYSYLLFYILIFMLDDLVIFFIAMTTLKAVGLNSKYSRYSHLLGGVLMLLIGLLLIFKPEFLMFG